MSSMDRWLTSVMKCGCGHQPFRFCCSVLPDMNESTSTRLMFTFLLFIGVVIQLIILSPGSQAALLENFPDLNDTCSSIETETNCHHVISYMAVYRLSTALVMFYFLFAIISLGIENSRNCRAGIHNGFWLVKFILLCALCAGAIIIPSTHVDLFSIAWRHINSVGAIIYTVVQLHILINFSHSWTENWLTRAKNGNSNYWFIAMVISGMLFFSVFTCGVILMYAESVYQKNCSLNQIVVGINLSLCLLAAFISVSPYAETYTGDARGGLLQSAIVSCYVMYLTWSAFLNKPPSLTTDSPHKNLSNYCNYNNNDQIFTYIGIVLVFLLLVYLSSHITPQKETSSAKGQHTLNQCQTCCPVLPNLQSEENDGGQIIIKNELQHVVYHYTSWHITLCLAVMYLTMQLTNWARPEAIFGHDDKQVITIWMKIVSSWLCLAVYFWLLLSACYQHVFKKVVNNTFDSQYNEAQV